MTGIVAIQSGISVGRIGVGKGVAERQTERICAASRCPSHDGGHQFWIGPGRIHLSVHLEKPHEKEQFKVSLSAWFAWTAYNLARMAIAFHDRGIDVYLHDYENIRKALLAEDDLAIVERGGDTRYAGHHGAFESICLSEIGSRYVTLKEFVRWKPLPMLRPREHKYNPIIKERL